MPNQMTTLQKVLLWPKNEKNYRLPWFVTLWRLPWVIVSVVVMYLSACILCAMTAMYKPSEVGYVWRTLTQL